MFGLGNGPHDLDWGRVGVIGTLPAVGLLSPYLGILDIVGGVGPYTVEVVTPLPLGLSAAVIGTQLRITGLASVLGLVNTTIRIRDSLGNSPADVAVSLTVL